MASLGFELPWHQHHPEAAVTLKDMGKVMNALRPQLMGRADLSLVSAKVKQHLGG